MSLFHPHPPTGPFDAGNLNVVDFADAQGQLQGLDSLRRFPRLCADLPAQAELDDSKRYYVKWQAQGLTKHAGKEGSLQYWMTLDLQYVLPQVCQRCMEPMDYAHQTQAHFRFVKSEQEAAMEDADAPESVLAASKHLNLMDLIEEEVLLSLPLVVTHESCPHPLPMQSQEQDKDAPNPAFAALAALKKTD